MYSEIYEDISKRTNGAIYAGIVGPVRTGKSTFIKKFMELAVIPNIENKYKKDRAVDELPQSGSGKSIMTCEPKFVPNEAVKLNLLDKIEISVRMIDCVGYMVEGAIGATEDGEVRMVQTPWSDETMPFGMAAEIGTRKVITDHSTIGIVVTTDGSFTNIPRSDYLHAEELVIKELQQLNKPFVVVLNTVNPYSEETESLKSELEKKYSVSVIALDVLNLTIEDIKRIFSKVLYEFPVKEISFKIPKWASMLNKEHWLNLQIEDFLATSAKNGDRIKSVIDSINENICESFGSDIKNVELSEGKINALISIDNSVFYKIMSDENGITIKNESDLFNVLAELLAKKKTTEILSGAITSALSSGYGVVYPDFASLKLSQPEMYTDSGKYGVSLKATADALHIIKTEISSEISPVIGAEAECNGFLNKLKDQYENSPDDLWGTEIFGRKLSEMMEDSIRGKLTSLSEETKQRLTRTLTKVANTQKGGLFIFWL